MNRCTLTIAGVVLACSAAMTRAENLQLAGSYAYAPERSGSVERAIDATVKDMNFILRPIARSRLGKTNQPYQRITLGIMPEQISITTDKRAPIVTTPDGKPVRWQREDGESMNVSTTWKGQALEQTFAATDGKRVNHYELAPDSGELMLKVTVTSSKLEQPLTYNLVYRRL